MNNVYYICTAIILFQHVLAIDITKLYHERDLSVFCKRKAIPSIFVGRHVVEASAFVLHFSKLDLPYSCFISVKSEAGSNFIMVLNTPEGGVQRPCSKQNGQFVVYTMEDTLAGYWGPIPDDLMATPTPYKYYTLKTSKRPVTPKPKALKKEGITQENTKEAATARTTVTEEFLEVEVPIVEVSGALLPGEGETEKPFDYDESFDYRHDVTPIPGKKYDTSIVPLVQLSVRKQAAEWRREGQEPRYDLDILQEFTPDVRLTHPKKPWKSNEQKHRTVLNRRLNFNKSRLTKSKKPPSSRKTTARSRFTKYVFPTTQRKPEINNEPLTWETIDEIIKQLNKHKTFEANETEYKNRSRIAGNVSELKNNMSIYLTPNLSIYDREFPRYNLKNSLSTFKTYPEITMQPTSSTIKPSKKHTTAIPRRADVAGTKNIHSIPSTFNRMNRISHSSVRSPASHTSKSTERQDNTKYTNYNSTHTNSKKYTPQITLADHEFWEKIFQVAPSLAVLLNQSLPYNVHKSDQSLPYNVHKSDQSSFNETFRNLKRKKRTIHSISIDNVRPHRLNTIATTRSTTLKSSFAEDMQELSRLVELEDDKIYERVMMRSPEQYLESAIYNICSEHDTFTTKRVVLFNASRIVLSINNFTLSKMSVILTSANTLLNSNMQCPSSQLECQVSGVRVCVDALAACDGVPNCGSNDIYDEDRLLCGSDGGLQGHVFLAALTFLAFLLTFFYAVYYWLKRCVPKVADAFFVYKNGVDNILNMETIMKSPMDDNDKFFFTSCTDNMFTDEFTHAPKKGFCSKLWIICCCCFRRKDRKSDESIFISNHELIEQEKCRKSYSFLRAELNKFQNATVDTYVQTGDSLEMAPRGIDVDDYKKRKEPPILIQDSLITLDAPLSEDELSLLKFFRNSRTKSNESIINKEKQPHYGGEIEMANIEYETEVKPEPGPSGLEFKSSMSSNTPSKIKRHIRFKDETRNIPSEQSLDKVEEMQAPGSGHRQTFRHNKPWRTAHLIAIHEDEESASKPRHFWEVKSKKHKK